MKLAHKVNDFESRLVLIPQEHVRETWLLAEPWLKKAERHHSIKSVEEWLGECINGKAQLWFLWADNDVCEGAGITSLVETPEGRICLIEAFGAKRRNDDHLKMVETWAGTQGCARIRIYGRIGWMQTLKNFKPIGVILDKELG